MRPRLSPRFERALVYAAQVHRTQTRKGKTVPYIAHLMSVTAIALEYGADEEQAVAALLHDAPEDQGGHARLREIRRQFGARVARIVEGCTDTFEEPKPDWPRRKAQALRKLPGEPAYVQLVFAADKLNNIREILADWRRDGEKTWSRFSGKRDGTIWYYRTIAKILRRSRIPRQLREALARAVNELPKPRSANPFR